MQACQFVPWFHYVSFLFFFGRMCKKKPAELLTIETNRREIIDFHFHSVVFFYVFGCCLFFRTLCYPRFF
jgi:hypothetical protein